MDKRFYDRISKQLIERKASVNKKSDTGEDIAEMLNEHPDIKSVDKKNMEKVLRNIDFSKSSVVYEGDFYTLYYFKKGDTYFIVPTLSDLGISNIMLEILKQINVFEDNLGLLQDIFSNAISSAQQMISSISEVNVSGFSFGEGAEKNRSKFVDVVKSIDLSMAGIIKEEVNKQKKR